MSRRPLRIHEPRSRRKPRRVSPLPTPWRRPVPGAVRPVGGLLHARQQSPSSAPRHHARAAADRPNPARHRRRRSPSRSPTTRAPTVELAAEPQAIVSLTPANTEILFELGAGDRVVATDDGSDYPGGRRRAPRRRDVLEPSTSSRWSNLEPGPRPRRRPGLHPGRRDHPAPRRSTSRSLVVYAPSVDGVYKDIELIGTATGTSEAAVALDGRHAGRDRRDQRCGRREPGHRRASSTRSATTPRPARSSRPPPTRSWPRW